MSVLECKLNRLRGHSCHTLCSCAGRFPLKGIWQGVIQTIFGSQRTHEVHTRADARTHKHTHTDKQTNKQAHA